MDLDGEKQIDEKLLDKFDYWLASRREATINYLSPYEFSRFSNASTDLSLDLFFISTKKEVDILKSRFDVFLRDTNTRVGSYSHYDDIPQFHDDLESGSKIKINEDDILVYFELITEPTKVPSLNRYTETGKPQGVGLKLFQETETRNTFSVGDVLRKNRK